MESGDDMAERRDILDICDVSSEAGVVASVIVKPELCFFSENLDPKYFSNEQNSYMYYACRCLAEAGVTVPVDTYNVVSVLKKNKVAKERMAEILPDSAIEEFVRNAGNIARTDVESYMVLVGNVIDSAFRRKLYNKLNQCQNLLFNGSDKEIEQKIYAELDSTMLEFSTTNDIPQYKDVVDKLWKEIVERQKDGYSGVPFKFPTLNKYATLERGELFIFGASQKQGKSMMLLNVAVDLMRKGLGVLYIDSELSTRMFTARLLSHLTRIPFGRLKNGLYGEEEQAEIDNALKWIKEQDFTHIYLPMFDSQSIYTVIKKVKHSQKLDAVIVDYFKSTGDLDAFGTYQEMGKLVDMIKNRVAGEMNLIAVGAAQTNASTGRLADSAKIARNASTIAFITEKTDEEIEQDGGLEYGNKKLRVAFNRNGMQHRDGEYISLSFNGDIISYEESKQPIPQTPY